MLRLFTLLVLVAIVVAVGAIAVAVWASGSNAESGRLNGVQKVAYLCLMLVMTGVATGWLGAE